MEENKNQVKRTSVEVHAYNPITWEAEPEGSRVQDKPGIHSKSVSKTQNKTLPFFLLKKDKESEDWPKTDSFTDLWEPKRHERSTRIPSGYTRGKGSWRWLHREISMEIQKLQPPLNSPWFGSPSYHLRLRECRPQEESTLCGNL